MNEYDQYRIEFSHNDIEKILKDHAEKYLKEKGYELEYTHREDSNLYPETTFRGVKHNTNKRIE